MILTCPACATRYFTDDAAIPARGRLVRCSACGKTWRAGAAIAAAAAEDTPPPDDPPPLLFAMRPAEPRRQRGAGPALAALLAGIVILAGIVVLFRTEVEQAWPASAGAYAAVLGK
jgi:predicted Zn finger-like uncharacterized protein